MEDRKENAPLLSMPQFEGSGQKEGVVMPEFSADFSKISLDQNSHDHRNQTPIDDLVEEEDEERETQCGECGEDYTTDQFWIRCDYCEKWYHGKCVKITPARAECIKQFRCQKCCKKKKDARA